MVEIILYDLKHSLEVKKEEIGIILANIIIAIDKFSYRIAIEEIWITQKTMKHRFTIIFAALLLLSYNDSFAQFDEDKMDKDLRVAAKVLESLTQRDDRLMMYSDNVEGNFLDGYGVIFTIGGGYSFHLNKSKGADENDYSSPNQGNRATVILPPDSTNEADKSNKANAPAIDMSDLMVEFLVDYSQMINQLSPTDKIIVSTKKSDYVYVGNDDEKGVMNNNGESGITTELSKKDHNDYLAGKITRDQLLEKILINRKNGEANKSKDLDLFASMLTTVYDDEFTDSYFISWKPEYQRLDGVGVIYSFKVYSSYDEDGLYRMPGIDKKGLSIQERNAEVEKLYPIFVQAMKENIVQYGRTINSLAAEEILILKVTLTKCDGCALPKKIQFSIKQSVLLSFKTGNLSEKEVITKVKVTDL